ncbi:MAG: radical SAM protein [Bacteroidia bacterium]|nr:radical SAM protein [Bacteroidia bacterium]
MIKEIQAKSALHYHDQKFATNWDVNIYRGCGHGCVYCFARYSHRYLDDPDFFHDIYVKKNIAELLDREFSKRSWCREPVNVSGVSDAYQPAEEQYRLMPDVIRGFIRHRNPLVIVTKSILPLRDIDLISELAQIVQVDILVSVSTLDERIRRITEPGSAQTADRLNMLSAFRAAGCRTGVLVMPVIPYLTDSEENLRGIYELASKNRVNMVLPGTLHLRGNTKEPLLQLVKKHFPELFPKISRTYYGANADEAYKNSLRTLIRRMNSEYGPWAKYTPPEPVMEINKNQQLSLF